MLLNSGVLPIGTTSSTDGIPLSQLVVEQAGLIADAERVRQAIFTTPSSETGSGLAHFESDMTLMPVVNGHDFPVELLLPATPENVAANGGIAMSYEAQGFVINLQAAYRDWTAASDARKRRSPWWMRP